MIPRHKIQLLTDDEACLLLYIVNINEESHCVLTYNELCWLNPKYVYMRINSFVSKVKPEFVSMLQSMVDKLVG